MEPNHSESFLYRTNNPQGLHKSEADHIAHFIVRMKQRFDLDITPEGYHEILSNLMKNGTMIYKVSTMNSIWEIKVHGKLIWVIYGNNSRDREDLPARLKTALTPYDGYPVPLKLAHIFDHHSFTVEVKRVVNQMIALSNELDFNDKKSFFIQDYPSSLKSGALVFKLNGNSDMPKLMGIAVKYLIGENTPMDIY